jgi:hypothetical protein
MKLGDISVSYVEILRKAMLALDSNPQLILQQFDLNSITLASPDARISIPRFMRLGFAGIQYSQKPWLGLEMGAQTRAANLGIAGLMALSAPDLKVACKSICHYGLLSSYNTRGQSAFYMSEGFGIAQFYSISPYNSFNLFVVDSVLSGWYSLAKWLTGRDDCIEAICFEFDEPEYSSIYDTYFDCDVRFSQSHNAVIIKPHALNYKVLHGCASTYELLKRQADADLEKVRLGDEGCTFQQVLNITRRDLAVSYVKDTAFTLGEIAYLLGFGSPAAFQRAFKRWMGVAPGSYRQSVSN